MRKHENLEVGCFIIFAAIGYLIMGMIIGDLLHHILG